MTPIERLCEMLEFRRPAFSVYEEAFIDRYIRPYNPIQDSFGNLIVDVGANPNILWSSHTDTVHRTSGLQILEKNNHGMVRARNSAESNCLGADCTTGVWIMLEMLDAGVEGRYIFHRDEEAGGLGSKWIAKSTPHMLTGIQAAIAFDRKGTSDIITHQGGQTASNEFAESLAAILGGNYKPSSHGMFTDTKNYAALVPECTNVSVGYEGAHSASETQNLHHALWLRNQMMVFDSSGLVIKRTPAEPSFYSKGYSSNYPYSSYQGGSYKRDADTIFDLVREAPTSTSKILEAMGFTFDTFKAAIDHVQSGKTINFDMESEFDQEEVTKDQIDSTVTFLQPTKRERKKAKIKQKRLTRGR